MKSAGKIKKPPKAGLVPAPPQGLRTPSSQLYALEPEWARAFSQQPLPSRGAARGHHFGEVALNPPQSELSSAFHRLQAGTCPLATPRTCPFGGACHTCPVAVQPKLADYKAPQESRSAFMAKEAEATRNVNDAGSSDEVLTKEWTPAPAPGVTPPSPPPPSAPAAPARTCHVTSGPSYTPSGTIPVTTTGGRKRASFSMTATFSNEATKGWVPACCEVRQYIKWDEAFHNWRGGPPHSGFPSSATFGTWYEDRDRNDKRYGHRSGSHSDPIAGCGDEYCTGGVRDQANGDTYCGFDNPGGPAAMTGTFNFKLEIIDTCNGNAKKASSSIITINW